MQILRHSVQNLEICKSKNFKSALKINIGFYLLIFTSTNFTSNFIFNTKEQIPFVFNKKGMPFFAP